MMKKLLVLALVLSMATMANAALVLSIDGPTELATGAVGVYTVSYAGGTILGSYVDIISDIGAQPFNIGNGVIITTNRDSSIDVVGINSLSGNYEVGILNDVAATNLGSPLFSFEFTAPLTVPVGGYAHISLLDNGQLDLTWTQVVSPDLGDMPSVAVHITPEPITMTLLGLGGLFLRRRK
jgi:hypothetical protein